MTVRIEEFVAHLGWEVDPGKLKEFDEQVNKISATFKKVALAIGAATAALTALVIHTNRETTELDGLAKAVGLTTENLSAMSSVVSNIGLNVMNVVDLVEEMNNKFGEKKGLGQMTSVENAVRLLNLDFKELVKLEPDKQFIKILDAAKGLEDQQKAVSAVDMIFGGEANKILGFIREMEGSLEEIIQHEKDLDFLTREGVDSAVKFNSAWSETTRIISTVLSQFSGLIGKTLTPLLKEFNEWVIQNRKLIKIKVAEWAEKVGFFLEVVWKFIKLLVGVISKVVKLFGGLENVLIAVVTVLGSLSFIVLINTLKMLTKILLPAIDKLGLLQSALEFGKMAGAIGLLVLAGLAVNSLVRFLQGKDSLVGDIGESIADSMIVGTEAIAGLFNMSGEELQYFLVQTVDGIGEFFVNIVDEIGKFSDEMAAIEWSEIWEFWKDTFTEGVEFIEGLFNNLLDFILSIPGKIIDGFKSLPGLVKDIIKTIPGIGLIAQGIDFFSGSTPTQANTQTGSPGLVNNIAQNRTLQNTVNRQRTQTQNNFNNRFNVTQQPGEDSERFANRVTEILEENAATAVRNNSSGVRV